jgi:hypothetical protein
LAYAFSCSFLSSESDITCYLQTLFRTRGNEYLKIYGKRKSQHERKIALYVKKLPSIVERLKVRMKKKGLTFVEKEKMKTKKDS